jgi:hypothetical protein
VIRKRSHKQSASSGIKVAGPDDRVLRFSFKLFDATDDEVCPPIFRDGYTRSLMSRLRDLSGWRVSDFTNTKSKSIRAHPIDWDKTARPSGFSQLNEQYQSYMPWQFSVSSNEHGRVHGIIIGECFYVIWLDCNHVVYS